MQAIITNLFIVANIRQKLALKILVDSADNYGILGGKKGFEMSKIIIGFNGWVEADPESIRFQYIGEMAAAEAFITGTDYLKLDEDERDNYILEDLGVAYQMLLMVN